MLRGSIRLNLNRRSPDRLECGIHYSTTCPGGSYRTRLRLWTKQLAGLKLCRLREQTKSSCYVSLVFRVSWASSIHLLEKCNIEVLEFKENTTTQAMKTHEDMSGAAKITMCITPPFKAFFVIISISWKSQGMYVCVCSVISESVKKWRDLGWEISSPSQITAIWPWPSQQTSAFTSINWG